METTNERVGMLISSLHVQRGREMRAIVEHDVAVGSVSVAAAIESLAAFLGIEVASVELAIAIANDADRPASERLVEVGA